MDVVEFGRTARTSVRTANGGLLASLGLTGTIGSVFASSCCVIPLTLSGLGAGAGIFTMLEALAPYRWPLIAMSAAVLTGAWFAFLKRSRLSCTTGADCVPKRAPGLGLLLVVATLQLGIATLWTAIEPSLVQVLPWL